MRFTKQELPTETTGKVGKMLPSLHREFEGEFCSGPVKIKLRSKTVSKSPYNRFYDRFLRLIIALSGGIFLYSAAPVYAHQPLSRINLDESHTITRTIPEQIADSHIDSNSLDDILNHGDLIDAVKQIEQNWLNEYLNYFQSDMPEIYMTANQIADTLALLGEQTGKKPALIYLVPNPNKLDVLLLLPNRQIIGKSIPQAKPKALIDVGEKLQIEVTAPVKRNKNTYLESAQQLYQWIIAPLELELQEQGIETLIFCVGSGLRTLPFAVLHDGEQFLVENYSLGLIPAFNLTESLYQDIKNSSVMAMGASEFEELSSLPGVPVELEEISEDLWQGESFLNEEFTLDNLRSQHQSKQFQIIHLATHAEFLPGDPSNSYIQFWDGELTLDLMGQLQLKNPPIELLVLSACQTAIGDRDVELGFAGLAVNSGVKSALASLWYVSDLGTLGLMSEFYQSLQTAPIKAEALREAQIAMLQGKVYIENGELHGTNNRIVLPPELRSSRKETFSHPYFWAGFTMIGSPW